MKKVLTALAASVAIVAVTVTGASAGGLFGKGGLIRGDVGNFIDKHVEKPILTPVARAATVIVGAAVATYVAGPLAAPVGAAVGEAVNQAVGPGGGGAAQTVAVQTGKTCSTDTVGDWPLDQAQPLGGACSIKFQNGKEFPGTVKA